ncbi:MAG: universal stress protein [Actinomycetota bacterium]|nr:universal stress protein [Actinomycetota bacterium]
MAPVPSGVVSGSVVTRSEAESFEAARTESHEGVTPYDEPPAPVVRPLVVGVDGSEVGMLALEWAAAEAAREGRPLHLVHAFEADGATVSPLVVAPLAWYDPEWSLRTAAERLGEIAPDLATTSTQSNEPPTQALIRASHDAALVVVGTRGHTAATALVVGSTAARVAAHAACPVAVVRERALSSAAQRVVVGLDGSPSSSAALGFAARWAAEHGCRLTVVHAWPGDITVDDIRAVATVRDEIRAAVTRGQVELTEALLQPARTTFPDLEIDVDVPAGDPGGSLVDESEDALLVVVGSRGRGLFKGLVLGSVSEHVLHHAHCPVVVVPSGVPGA